MARSRSPSREKAEKMYIESKGDIKLKDIADSLQIPEGTIRGWKNKDHWEEKMNGTFQIEATKNTERSKRKKGGQPGNKNSLGNSGGAPAGNKNSEIHGLFSKYLPEETLELMEEVKSKSPLDILWDQIMIQYAAIIRAQKIMHVKDQEDMTKVLKRQKESSGDTSDSWEKEYELQFAWDKQATFLQAQSRAMTTLERMIKSYDELLKTELATEEQKARIEVLKAKVPNKGITPENKELSKLNSILAQLKE